MYYKAVRVANFYSNNYIEFEGNAGKCKTLSIDEYLEQIKPYLKGILNNLKKSDIQKIQLTLAIQFISSKDINKECVMHSKSDNIEITIDDKADEVIK